MIVGQAAQENSFSHYNVKSAAFQVGKRKKLRILHGILTDRFTGKVRKKFLESRLQNEKLLRRSAGAEVSINKKVPRSGRVAPFIPCTTRQVGCLSGSYLLPTSIHGQSRDGRPAIRDGSPTSRKKDVGLKGTITNPAGNLCNFQFVLRTENLRPPRPRRENPSAFRRRSPAPARPRRPPAAAHRPRP